MGAITPPTLAALRAFRERGDPPGGTCGGKPGLIVGSTEGAKGVADTALAAAERRRS